MNSKWEQFRPSKSLWFWSCAGTAVLTMVVGFTVGGWVTGGTAADLSKNARRDGRAQLAADVCVARFKDSAGFAADLVKLKAENSWSRDNFVVDAGWVTLAGISDPVAGAAELCAQTLSDLKVPAAASTDNAVVPKG